MSSFKIIQKQAVEQYRNNIEIVVPDLFQFPHAGKWLYHSALRSSYQCMLWFLIPSPSLRDCFAVDKLASSWYCNEFPTYFDNILIWIMSLFLWASCRSNRSCHLQVVTCHSSNHKETCLLISIFSWASHFHLGKVTYLESKFLQNLVKLWFKRRMELYIIRCGLFILFYIRNVI